MDAPGLNFLIYSAEAGSATAERLRLLASWAATSPAVPLSGPRTARSERSDSSRTS